MIVAYLRLTRLALGLGFFLPAVIFAGSFFQFGARAAEYWIVVAILAAVGAGLSVASGRLLRRLAPAIGEMAAKEATFLDRLPDRWVPLAIAAGAGGAWRWSSRSSAGRGRSGRSSPSTRTSACCPASPGSGWATRSPAGTGCPR